MKEVFLYFKKIKLGSLSESNGEYLWTPFFNGINEYEKTYPFDSDFLFLNKTTTQLFKKIPRHFNEFVFASERTDLHEHAKIEDSDSDFIKLYKMASLDFYEDDFYIKLK